jgi:TetR/AcrR family transcriptional regulator
MSRSWKRANGEEKKQIRRREILDAALQLNETCPFSQLSLADIARSASFTRSNLYKYYSCREDLFLALLEEELLFFLEEVEKTFKGRRYNLKEFSHLWVDLLLKHNRMIELQSLSSVLLEKHAGEEALNSWYQSLNENMSRLNHLIGDLFPTIDSEDIDEFLHVQTAQVIGLVPMLKLDAKQKELRKKNGLTYSRNYFSEVLCHAVESLLSPWI